MILEIIIGIIIGVAFSYWFGGRKIENLQDEFTYGKYKKYL